MIDKLYFLRKEFKATGINEEDMWYIFDEYKYEKSPVENSRVARNNMIFELIRQRLMDQETFNQRTTPGGFAGASYSARIMREILYGDPHGFISNGVVNMNAIEERAKTQEDPEPKYSASDPMTLVRYNQQNQIAGKLIGIFANQNTNYAISSLMKELKTKKPISFAGKSNDNLLANSYGVDTSLTMAELLAASVDAVKDPILNYLNLNTVTADAGALLARLGYTTTEIGLLFNQPIIKELCDYTLNEGIRTEQAIIAIKRKYKKSSEEDKLKKPSTQGPSTDTLIRNILNYKVLGEKGEDAFSRPSFLQNQLQVLELFSNVMQHSSFLSDFIMSSKFTASNAIGSTFGDMYAQQMKSKKTQDRFNMPGAFIQYTLNNELGTSFLDPSFTDLMDKNSIEYFSDDNLIEYLLYHPFGYEQVSYDCARNAVKALQKYYPYDTTPYRDAKITLANVARSSNLDADTIDAIHRDMLTFILSGQLNSMFDGENIKNFPNHGVMTMREYYTEHFADDLYVFLENNPKLKELPIFKYMQFEVSRTSEFERDITKGNTTVSLNNVGGLLSIEKEEITQSWADLFNDAQTEDIATDLMLYNFYKNGFNFSPTSFMNLAPAEVKEAIECGVDLDGVNEVEITTYSELLKNILNGKIYVDNTNFCKQFILNHLDNWRFVTKISPTSDAGKAIAQQQTDSSFKLTIDVTNPDMEAAFVLNSDKDLRTFAPVIEFNGNYYMANSIDGNNIFKYTTSLIMEYVRVNPLGNGSTSTIYSKEDALDFAQYKSSQSPKTDINPTDSNSNSKSNSVESNGIEDSNDSEDGGKEEKGSSSAIDNSMSDKDKQENFNREEAVSYVMKEIAKACRANRVEFMAEEFEKDLKAASDAELKDTVNDVRTACRENGIMILDENGIPKHGC